MKDLEQLKERLRQAAQGLQPAIYRRRTREAELLQELGIRVLDWNDLKMGKELSQSTFLLGGSLPQSKLTNRVSSETWLNSFFCMGKFAAWVNDECTSLHSLGSWKMLAPSTMD
jgi:hypothetical protein